MEKTPGPGTNTEPSAASPEISSSLYSANTLLKGDCCSCTARTKVLQLSLSTSQTEWGGYFGKRVRVCVCACVCVLCVCVVCVCVCVCGVVCVCTEHTSLWGHF